MGWQIQVSTSDLLVLGVVEPEPQGPELFALAEPARKRNAFRIWNRIQHKWNDKIQNSKKNKELYDTFWATMR
jgi:hypothetical protein